MKRNIIYIIIAIAVLLSSFISVYAMTNDEEDFINVYYAPSDDKSIDVKSVKNNKVLKPDLYTAEYTEGETVLSVSWGESEDTLACRQNMEMLVTNGPQSFTVGDDGTVYIYDTYNTKLKAFKNNKLISSLNLYDINGRGDGVGLVSMAYLDGSIYALEFVSTEIYKITGSNIEKLEGFGESGDFEKIISTPCGELIIRDNNWKDGSIRTRNFTKNGNLIYENKMGFYISDSSYRFNDEKGNIIRMIDNGYMNTVFIKEDKDGNSKNAVNNNLYDCTLQVTDDGNGFSMGMTLIGTDSKGRAYIELSKYKWNNYVVTVDESYLVRLDIENETIDTIEIPVAIKYEEMPISGEMLNSTFVASDGSVYKAYMSVTDGAKIIKFNIG